MIADLYAHVNDLAVQDRARFNAAVGRLFGPPDYSEDPELAGYFDQVVAKSIDEAIQRDIEAELSHLRRERDEANARHNKATEHVNRLKQVAQAAHVDRNTALGALEKERLRSKTLLTAAMEEWRARLPPERDFTIAPADRSTPPELAAVT